MVPTVGATLRRRPIARQTVQAGAHRRSVDSLAEAAVVGNRGHRAHAAGAVAEAAAVGAVAAPAAEAGAVEVEEVSVVEDEDKSRSTGTER
jgi:hypothetical protein